MEARPQAASPKAARPLFDPERRRFPASHALGPGWIASTRSPTIFVEAVRSQVASRIIPATSCPPTKRQSTSGSFVITAFGLYTSQAVVPAPWFGSTNRTGRSTEVCEIRRGVVVPKALDLLKQVHRTVEDLFAQFESDP
jgi:hypothetical protein